MASPPLLIQMWSGPRNVSTAMMYAFRQRSDTLVLDEPLYSNYLSKVEADHPAREEVIASQNPDGDMVMRELARTLSPRPYLFLKQMAHHLVGVSWEFMSRGRHFLLVRDPRGTVPSLGRVLDSPVLDDTGLALQVSILEKLRAFGHEPLVVDSGQLLRNPRSVLGQLCERLGLAFEEEMLHWPAGPKPEDGVWAAHWYASAHRTTGFLPYSPRHAPLPERLRPLLQECLPYYAELRRHAIQAECEASR